MKKKLGVVFIFLFVSIAMVIVGITMVLYFSPSQSIGFVVLDDYDNETSCIGAGYSWEDLTEENCTIVTTCTNQTIECEPCTDYEEINDTQGDCIEWSVCNNQTCIDDETCVDVVIGGQCTGDICDSSHISLCLDETNCTASSGYWYDDLCNAVVEPACSNDFSLCLDETNCTSASNYWYDEVCNENECSSDSHCNDDYECNSGSCEYIEEETTSESTATTTAQVVSEVVTTPTYVAPTPAAPVYGLILEGGQWSLSLKPFESWEITTYAKNTGDTPLSSCTLSPHEYISFSEKSVNIAVGEQEPFAFTVKAPEISGTQIYTIPISVNCAETSVSQSLSLEVVKKSFEFNLIELRKIKKDKIRVTYNLEDLVNLNHTVTTSFSLYDNMSIIITEASQVNNLSANTTEEFSMILIINETLNKTIGENMSIKADAVSEVYSGHLEEEVIVTTSFILGFATLGGESMTINAIVFVAAIFAIALIIFVVRRVGKGESILALRS